MIQIRIYNKKNRRDTFCKILEHMAELVMVRELSYIKHPGKNLNEISEQVFAEQMGWLEC